MQKTYVSSISAAQYFVSERQTPFQSFWWVHDKPLWEDFNRQTLLKYFHETSDTFQKEIEVFRDIQKPFTEAEEKRLRIIFYTLISARKILQNGDISA